MTWFGMKRAEFKPGFRDLKWGDSPPPGMTVLKKEGDEVLYSRPADSLRIGEARLASIHYQFWKGKLSTVILSASPGTMKTVMEHVVGAYGKPSQPNPLKQKFYWMSLGSGETATQAIADVTDAQGGTIIIFSKAIADRRKMEDAKPVS